jgi:hypothetical protein
MPLFFTFFFLSDDTLQDITSHNFFSYDEAGVYKWSCCGITHICDEAGAS